jgi:hypothetical protein
MNTNTPAPRDSVLPVRDPELTAAAGLRVVPPLRRRARALPDWVVPAVAVLGIVLGLAITLAGVFGVAMVTAGLIVAALVRDEGPRVWRRLRRR